MTSSLYFLENEPKGLWFEGKHPFYSPKITSTGAHHVSNLMLGFSLNSGFLWSLHQTFQTFSSSRGLNSPHEQWRRENGQRYCLATMAKDTDCPGWRDEMTFLWKQEQHNLNEFCWVRRGAILTCHTKWSGKQTQEAEREGVSSHSEEIPKLLI